MANPHLRRASALFECMARDFAEAAEALKRVAAGFNRLAVSKGRGWAMPNRGAIVIDKVIAAAIDAAKAGITPTAVVLGEGQWREVVAGRPTNYVGQEMSVTPPTLIGLIALVSAKVAGPLVVADDVRGALEASGIARRP